MARSNETDPLRWWSPRKILLQILLLQLSYTITATIMITFLVLVMGAPFRIDYFFLYQRFRTDNTFGWSLSFLSILNAVFGVLFLVLVVRRSQLVIDFALTTQFIHFILTMWYNWRFPSTGLWWVTTAVASCIMIFGGRYFCMKRELRPIEFGTYEMVSTDPERDVERGEQNGVQNGEHSIET